MTLNVMMLDRFRTEIAIVYENGHVPYGRRVVSIELTPEQEKALERRHVGISSGADRHEEYGEIWLSWLEPLPMM